MEMILKDAKLVAAPFDPVKRRAKFTFEVVLTSDIMKLADTLERLASSEQYLKVTVGAMQGELPLFYGGDDDTE